MAWWFWGERRGPQWKQGWRGQTLTSMSLPPLPLIAVFAIVILFLSIKNYVEYRKELHHTLFNFHMLLFLLPVLLIFVARSVSEHGRLVLHIPRPQHDAIHRAGSSPWGVALLLILLFAMISYQSSFQSRWFWPFSRYY